MKRSINRTGGAIITLMMAASFYLAAGSTALAQYRQYPEARNRQERRDRNDRYRNNRRHRRDRRDDRYRRNGDVYGNNGGYDNNGGYYDNGRQVELNQGYQNGLSTGARDAERGQSYSPQRSHFYKEASSQAFRDGFVRGYDEGFRRYAGYDNGGNRRRNPNSGIGSILGGILGRP